MQLGLFASLLCIAIYLLYKYMTRHFDYWKQRNVWCKKPVPFFGNILDVFLTGCSLGDWLKNMSHSVKERYYGILVLDTPALVINDPDLVKYILIKDFNKFRNRSVSPGQHDEIMKEMMFFQRDPNWRASRVNLTAIYSTGRLKNMFLQMNRMGVEFEDYIEKRLGDIDDIKKLVNKWTIEVVSRTTFGIQPNCFTEENSEFYRFGEKLFEITITRSIAQFCYFFKQDWVDLLHLMFFPKDSLRYFQKIITDTLESRKESGLKANDIINVIKEANCDEKSIISTSVLASSAVQIFAGGFETTSTAISFLLYELAKKPEAQDKLRREIIDVTEKHGELTLEALSEMEYLNMCVTEILRMYPILPFLDRVCGEDYKLPGTDLIVEKGMNVYIPLAAFHYNEEFYPDPYTFNPDRFEDGSTAYRESMKFLAFGAGPRVCMGERFGIMVCKTCIYYLLTKFEVVKNPKTQENIKYSIRSQLTAASGGLPMRLQRYVPDVK